MNVEDKRKISHNQCCVLVVQIVTAVVAWCSVWVRVYMYIPAGLTTHRLPAHQPNLTPAQGAL